MVGRGGCGYCYLRSIIYSMKEDLLDATKKVASPSGVNKGLWQRYLNQIRGSGGFDLDENNYPKGSDHATLSTVKFQRDGQDLTYKNLCKISSKALEWMAENNVEKGEGFKFVDVVKANELKGGMGILYSYFITFKAKNCSDVIKEFQTEAECRPQVNKECLFTDRLPPVVKFCRMKPN